MSSETRAAVDSANSHAPRLFPASLSSFVVVGLLLASVLLPRIAAGCGPPT